jgi:hypothetical protein
MGNDKELPAWFKAVMQDIHDIKEHLSSVSELRTAVSTPKSQVEKPSVNPVLDDKQGPGLNKIVRADGKKNPTDEPNSTCSSPNVLQLHEPITEFSCKQTMPTMCHFSSAFNNPDTVFFLKFGIG